MTDAFIYESLRAGSCAVTYVGSWRFYAFRPLRQKKLT